MSAYPLYGPRQHFPPANTIFISLSSISYILEDRSRMRLLSLTHLISLVPTAKTGIFSHKTTFHAAQKLNCVGLDNFSELLQRPK